MERFCEKMVSRSRVSKGFLSELWGRLVPLLFCTLVLASCDPVEVSRPITDVSSGGSGGGGQKPPADGSVYVTGVEYPQGVDWMASSGYDIDGCILFLMKDGKRILELKTGADRCISGAPDMHRCLDGHLYTDYSTASQTIVKCDGHEIFRFDGREMFLDMLLLDGVEYTLGQPRSGGGVTFRKKGDLIFSREDVQPISGLMLDDGNICFAYESRVGIASSLTVRHYLVKNGTSSLMQVPTEVISIGDFLLKDGKQLYVGKMLLDFIAILYEDTKKSILQNTSDLASTLPATRASSSREKEVSACRFLGKPVERVFNGESLPSSSASGYDPYIQGRIVISGVEKAAFWHGSRLLFTVDSDAFPVGSAADWQGNVWCALAGGISPGDAFCGTTICKIPTEPLGKGDLRDLGEVHELDGYDCIYETCVAACGDRICVGLIDRTHENRPAIWDSKGKVHDFGQAGGCVGVTELPFNGVITSISYW